MTKGMVVNEDDLVRQVMEALPVIGRRLFASMSGHPVNVGRPLGQVKALAYLYHSGPRTVKDVARFLDVAMPTASELVDRLVDEGLVERTVNPADRRQVLLDLAPQAREVGQEIHAMRLAQIRAAMDLLEPEERAVFAKSLQALATVLERDAHTLTNGDPADAPALAGSAG